MRTTGTRVPERGRAYRALPVGAAAGHSSGGPADRPLIEDRLEIVSGGQAASGGGCSRAGGLVTLQRQVRAVPAAGGDKVPEIHTGGGGTGARQPRAARDGTSVPAARGGGAQDVFHNASRPSLLRGHGGADVRSCDGL